MSNKPMEILFFKSLRSQRIALSTLVATLFVTIISLVFYEETKKSVTLYADGEELDIDTHANTVGALLEKQNIQVADRDLVTPSMNTPIKDGLTVRWEQSKKITIEDGEETREIWTTGKHVSDVIADAGIELSKHDVVSPSLHSELRGKDTVFIHRAFLVTLKDGKKEKEIWTTSTTVADFLERENIRLNEHDRLNRKVTGFLKPGSLVQVTRIEKVTDVVEEPKNFAVKKQKDADLLAGQEKIVKRGSKGKVERTYEVLKKNGHVVSRKVVNEKVIQQPKDQVIAVGTKKLLASAKPTYNVSRGSTAPAGGKEFYVTATAYTAQCNGCSGISATGINLRANPNLKVVAVDPNVIPLGSKVWVEGYGYAVAGDTGGAIKGNKIDLHVPTKSDAYKFGRRTVKLKVIE